MSIGELSAETDGKAIRIGRHLVITFQRTLRIPDDGGTYPLPPGLGAFPIYRVWDYADRVPESWLERGGAFIPMYQREALWISFLQPDWRPAAVKIGIGGINAVSGKRWHERINRTRRHQDHIVCPDQPWLDGINAGDGFIRQFVAMPLGMGYTVEGQLTGEEKAGGIQLVAFEPKPGLFADRPPPVKYHSPFVECAIPACCDSDSMGLGAGGKMRQEIYPDPYGADTWDLEWPGGVDVHIVNSTAFTEITGLPAPPTPVSARTYTDHGFPWFDLYDEGRGDLDPSDELAGVKTVKEIDASHGFSPQHDDAPVRVGEAQVKIL